ncbi:MAG: hypothetical protein AB7N65_25780 [Vicinamibacterales bacterium]
MMQRTSLTPTFNSSSELTADDVLAHLRQWRADTTATRASLNALREQVAANSRQLENPNAAFEYIDFFDGFFSRVTEELDRLLADLPASFMPGHSDTLRQLAKSAAAEQRRTVVFRDKWVNKPLPYEAQRPLLTRLADDVRDQLSDYRELSAAAQRLQDLHPAPATLESQPGQEGLGRRELFSRLVRPLGDRADS